MQRFFHKGFDLHYFLREFANILQAESDCLKDENCIAFTASTSEATDASIVSIYRSVLFFEIETIETRFETCSSAWHALETLDL